MAYMRDKNGQRLDSIAVLSAAQIAADPTVRAAFVPVGNLAINVKDYGAKGDGVADDFKAIQDAINAAQGHGTVYLPAGSYRLAKAGARGLRLPESASGLTIEGAGIGTTTIMLTPEVPRAFDLWRVSSDPLFSNLTLRRFTVDAANLDALSQGPLTAIPRAYTLNSGWNSLSVASTAGWVSAAAAYFPATNTGTAAGKYYAMRVPTGSTTTIEVRNDGATATVSAGDFIQGFLSGHVIIGDNFDGGTSPNWNASVYGLTVEDVRAIGVRTQTAGSLGVITPTARQGIQIQPSLSSPAATPSIQKIRYRRVEVQGGAIGFATNYAGQSPVTAFIDDVLYEDLRHTTGVLPTSNYTSLNFMVGGGAFGNRATIRRCWGALSGDVGIETDSIMDVLVEDCTIEDAWGGNFYSTNFNSPADTIAGPPTATLSAALTAGATNMSVTAVPQGIAMAGYCRVDQELFWYLLGAASTTINFYRALNGTAAVAHSTGAAVVFHEAHRQRLVYRNCRSKQRRLAATTAWCPKGWYQFPGYASLPCARVFIRDSQADCSYVEMESGGADVLRFDGVTPLVDIDGLSVVRDGINHTALDGARGRVMRFRRTGNTYPTNPTQVFPDRIRLRNVDVRVSGALASGTNSPTHEAVAVEEGYWELDEWDLKVHQQLAGAGAARTVGLVLGVNPSNRLVGTIDRYRYTSIQGDPSPRGMVIPSTTFSTIRNLRIRELEFDQMNYATGAGQTNYSPFTIDATNAAAVVIEKVRHPASADATTAGFPVVRTKRTAVAANYTATHLDAYVGVTSTAAARTITLPAASGGTASGVLVAAGTLLTIKDESGAAATNNITVVAAGADLIDGVASKVINVNYGSIQLLSTGSGWSVL